MQCISCGNEIDGRMRAAIDKNECPYCAGQIMEPKRLEQLRDLEDVLSRKRFTNKENVDNQIREKVIELLLENFEFSRIEKPESDDDDVIVVDQEVAKSPGERPVLTEENIISPAVLIETSDSEDDDTPSRSLTAARSKDPSKDPELRQQALAEAKASMPDARVYREAFQGQGVDVSDLPLEELDNLSQEELQALFPGSDPATAAKVEHLKNIQRVLPKKMGSTKISGAGTGKPMTRRA